VTVGQQFNSLRSCYPPWLPPLAVKRRDSACGSSVTGRTRPETPGRTGMPATTMAGADGEASWDGDEQSHGRRTDSNVTSRNRQRDFGIKSRSKPTTREVRYEAPRWSQSWQTGQQRGDTLDLSIRLPPRLREMDSVARSALEEGAEPLQVVVLPPERKPTVKREETGQHSHSGYLPAALSQCARGARARRATELAA
jgi:hypothetical protein